VLLSVLGSVTRRMIQLTAELEHTHFDNTTQKCKGLFPFADIPKFLREMRTWWLLVWTKKNIGDVSIPSARFGTL